MATTLKIRATGPFHCFLQLAGGGRARCVFENGGELRIAGLSQADLDASIDYGDLLPADIAPSNYSGPVYMLVDDQEEHDHGRERAFGAG